MSTNKILLKFAKKGINLSPEAYEKYAVSDYEKVIKEVIPDFNI
mgnify:CR=1 FL=1